MPDLICCICLFTRTEAAIADTIINGQAVCLDHHGYVQGSPHSYSLIAAKEDAAAKRAAKEAP